MRTVLSAVVDQKPVDILLLLCRCLFLLTFDIKYRLINANSFQVNTRTKTFKRFLYDG